MIIILMLQSVNVFPPVEIAALATELEIFTALDVLALLSDIISVMPLFLFSDYWAFFNGCTF